MRYLFIFLVCVVSLSAQSFIDEDTVHFVGQASAFTVGDNQIVNGDFASGDTGWTISEGTGSASVVAEEFVFLDDAGGGGSTMTLGRDFTVAPEVGQVYRLSYDITANTGVIPGEFILDGGGAFPAASLGLVSGRNTIYLEVDDAAGATDLRLVVANTEENDTLTIDNIEVVLWVGDLDAASVVPIDEFSGTLTNYMTATGGVLAEGTTKAITDGVTICLLTDVGAFAGLVTGSSNSMGIKLNNFSDDVEISYTDGIYICHVVDDDTIAITGLPFDDDGDGTETCDYWLGGAYPDIATANNDSTLSQGTITLAFTEGGKTVEPVVGDTLDDDGTAASATIANIIITSGTMAGNNAVGTFILTDWNGTAYVAGDVDVGGVAAAVIAGDASNTYRKRSICVNVPQLVDTAATFVAETSETTLKANDGSRKLIGFNDSISAVNPGDGAGTYGYRIVSDMDEGQTYYGGALKAFQDDESFTGTRPNGKRVNWDAQDSDIKMFVINTSNVEMRNFKMFNTIADGGATDSLLHIDTAFFGLTLTNCIFDDSSNLFFDDTPLALNNNVIDCYFGDELDDIDFADFRQVSGKNSIFNGTGVTTTIIANNLNSNFSGCLFYGSTTGLTLASNGGLILSNNIFYNQSAACVTLGSGTRIQLLYNNNIFIPAAAADSAVNTGSAGGTFTAAGFNNIMWTVAGVPMTDPVEHDDISPNSPLPVGTIEADPLFVNAADGDFRLQPDSPGLFGGLKGIFGNPTHIGAASPEVEFGGKYRPRY